MKLTVSDLMTREVSVIQRSASLKQLEKLIAKRGVHGLPVVDESNRIVGVVSQTDVLAWYSSAELSDVPFYQRPEEEPARTAPSVAHLGDRPAPSVAELMSPLVHCIGPDRSAAEAAARMVRESIHRLIVVDGSYAVVGILSATDLLRALPGVGPLLATQPR